MIISTLFTLTCLLNSSWLIENVRVEIGNGKTLDSTSVLIRRGKIAAIGKNLKASRHTKRLNGHDKVLTPGLVESLSQLGLTEVSMVKSTNDYRLKRGPLVPGFRAVDGFNAASVRIPIARAQGITTAMSNPRGSILYGTGALFDLQGTWASAPNPLLPTAMFGGIGDGAAQAAGGARGGVWLALRQAIKDTQFWLQHRASFNRGNARTLSLSPVHLRALVPVIEGRLPLVLEADRASDILKAVEFCRAHGIKLVIAGGTEAWLVAKHLAKHQVPVILRPSVQAPWGFEALAARDDIATLLHRAGVPIILSAGGWSNNVGRLRQEAGIAVAYGLPHAAALQAITATPAGVFAPGRRFGKIQVGQQANLVLWSGDPFELSSVAEQIWIEGKLQNNSTRQLQLAKRYLQPARPWQHPASAQSDH